MKAALQHPLFTAWPDYVLPVHNINAVAESKFYLIGKIIATGLVQGGEPPVCFSAAVADFIVYDSVRSKFSIDDIPDHDVRDALRKVLVHDKVHVHVHVCVIHAITVVSQPSTHSSVDGCLPGLHLETFPRGGTVG